MRDQDRNAGRGDAGEGPGTDDPPAAPAPEAGRDDPDRRATLADLARWAALAPAMAVLFDPDGAEAAPSFGDGD
jgi:hypothetical protein